MTILKPYCWGTLGGSVVHTKEVSPQGVKELETLSTKSSSTIGCCFCGH